MRLRISLFPERRCWDFPPRRSPSRRPTNSAGSSSGTSARSGTAPSRSPAFPATGTSTTPGPPPAGSGRPRTPALKWRPVFDDQDVHAVGALGGLGIRPEHRLGGHRRDLHPGERLHRHRGLQVHRRRGDLAAHGPRRHGADRADHHPPHEPGHRLRGVARARLLAAARTRRLPHHGRGRNVGEGPLRGRGDRGLGHGHRPEQPPDPVRRDVAARPPDLGPDERRARQRALDDPRRRRHLDRTRGQRPADIRHRERSRSA